MPFSNEFRTGMTALLVAGIGGYFSATFAMREQMGSVIAKQEALKDQVEAVKQELISQIKQVDANSAQRRNDTREEMLNQIQNVHTEMSELRQQIFRKP